MIYKDSYFKKELRQSYIQNISTGKQYVFGLFIGLFSVGLHLLLLTLTDSVLSDAAPYLVQRSYFTTLYTHNFMSLFLIVIYIIVYYNDLTFEEIRRNCWYLLCKMGYKPVVMILSKLMALLFSLIAIYTTGFITTIVLTTLLKYDFRYEYIPSLYFAGLNDLLFLSFILLTASLFIKKINIARYFSLLVYISQMVLRDSLGFKSLVTSRVAMQNPINLILIGNSLYMPLTLIIILCCIIICIFRAKSIAKYYSLPTETYTLYNLPAETKILKMEPQTGKLQYLYDAIRLQRRTKLINGFTSSIIICIISFAIIFNIFVIMVSISKPDGNTFTGLIPYIFMSDTMKPEINKNDFVCFKTLEDDVELRDGQIVIFKQGNTVYVERIVGSDENNYVVDIDYYPPMSEVGSMIKTVSRDEIFGIYVYKNRWVGAMIMVATTLWGRIIFLLVPILLLFFYKPIKDFLNKLQS
jgi:hypothetical protein